jgi:hypothetical protein
MAFQSPSQMSVFCKILTNWGKLIFLYKILFIGMIFFCFDFFLNSRVIRSEKPNEK